MVERQDSSSKILNAYNQLFVIYFGLSCNSFLNYSEKNFLADRIIFNTFVASS